MKAIYKRRLLKLAAFLDTLKRKQFNIRAWVTDYTEDCGTVCCAIGWCPKVFPKHWEWDVSVNHSLYPVLKESPPAYLSIYSSIGIFFGVSDDEILYLFVPKMAGGVLPLNTSPQQVAAHIRKFVAAH